MLANLSVSEQSEEVAGDPDVFTLQQYQEEVAAGRLKPYQVCFILLQTQDVVTGQFRTVFRPSILVNTTLRG